MARVFMDATATANTLLHTGIQRVVRSIVRHGSERIEPITPVVWDGKGGFRFPKKGEIRRLSDVFEAGVHRNKPISRMLDLVQPAEWVDWKQYRDLPVLLVPEIPSGERLRGLASMGLSVGGTIRIIAICHDVLSWSHPEFTHPDRAREFGNYLRFLCGADRVICPSRETAREFLRFRGEEGVSGPEPEVAGWPVDGERAPVSDVWRDPMVLCVGTLEERKNHRRLLTACENLWREGLSFRLQLVGRLRARGEDEVPKEVERLQKAGHKVSWISRANDSMLDEFYRGARFTVFPSLAEGFGLPVAESLKRGRPCVCSLQGAVGEIAGGGGCEGVDVTDPSSIAEGVKRLLTDEARYSMRVEEALSRKWPTWADWLHQVLG